MFINDQKLKDMVEAAVVGALTVDLTLERRTDAAGQPLRVPEVKTERVFLPSVLVQQFYRHEGALRGLQEDLGKHAVAAVEIRRLAESIEAARPYLERIAAIVSLPRMQETGNTPNVIAAPTGEIA